MARPRIRKKQRRRGSRYPANVEPTLSNRTHLKDTDQEYAMPFYWRAIAEAKLGQGEAASADLTVAEETHRRAIAHLPEMKKMYVQYLASILKQHANLLEEMGKPEEAAKLRAEASSL